MQKLFLSTFLITVLLLTQGCSGLRRSADVEAGNDTYEVESDPINGQSVESEAITEGTVGGSDIYGPEVPSTEAPAEPAEQTPIVKEKPKPKLCLVLGPGLARGAAHAGVIEALVRNQIPIHCIVGVEMGAVVGAFYAMNSSVNTMQWQLFKFNKDTIFNFPIIAFGAKRSSGKEFHGFLKTTLGDLAVEQLKIKFMAVATQPGSAQPVPLTEGNVADVLSASMAQPGIFEAWKMRDGRKLLGGGISSPSPVELARKFGATLVVSVSVLPEPGEPAGRSDELFEKAFVPVLNLSHLQERGADILIKPDLRDAAYDDFNQVGTLVAAGREKANEAAEEIKAAWERAQEAYKAQVE